MTGRNRYWCRWTSLVPLDVEQLIGADHVARAIWELTGKLELKEFYEPIVSAEGRAGRRGWDPRLLLSVWLYAYSKGENSARAIAEEMSHEPGLMWLAGLGEVNHDRLSGFRRNHQEGLDELFGQLLAVIGGRRIGGPETGDGGWDEDPGASGGGQLPTTEDAGRAQRVALRSAA